MLNYFKSFIQKSLKSEIDELVHTFSNFDSFSEDEKKQYTIYNYIPKITNIASFLDKLAKNNHLSLLIEKCSKEPDFDPRYVSKYSSKWNQEPDERSKINQDLIDLESKLKIEDSPEARFVLFNALRDISENYVEAFELKKIKASKTDFKSLLEYLTQDFDVIEMKNNQRSKNKTRLTRKEFELYVLGELRKKVFENLSNNFIKKNYNDSYGINYINLSKFLTKYNLNSFSDVSVEEFIKTQENNSLDASLFNYLFNSCVRTKEDFKVEKNIDCLLYKQNNLFGRKLIFNGDGDWQFYKAKDIFAVNLEANGNGDWRFNQANNIITKNLKVNGNGDWQFSYAKNIIAVNLEANGNGKEFFKNFENLITENFKANGKGWNRFYKTKNFIINGKKYETFTEFDLRNLL